MDLKDELVELLEKRFDCCDISQIVEFMVEGGILDQKNIKYYFIKKEYYERVGKGDSFTEVKYDLSAEFDCTYSTVKNIIYKYKHLQP